MMPPVACGKRSFRTPATRSSFNRPHASGYAVQAYQDAWLKLRYPFEFYAVLLSLEPEKTLRAIKEMVHFGVEVVNPDVNTSKKDFTIDFENRCIRYGLIGIDGIGETSANQCMEKAPYESLEHFQMSHSFKYTKLNKGHLQALIESGALDSIGAREDWTESQRAETEQRRLGMSLRPGGTFGDDEPLVFAAVHSQDEVAAMQERDPVVVAGRISDVRQTTVKRGPNAGQEMGMIRLRFGLDTFDCTFFSAAWAVCKDLLEKGNGIIVKGRRDAGEAVIATSAMNIEEWLEQRKETLVAS